MSANKPSNQKHNGRHLLNWTGWLIVLSCWGMVIVHYTQLPNLIPTHFNGAGEADDYSQKQMIFMLPTLLTILCIGLTLLNRYPHTFNYPIEITSQNKTRQYQNAQLLISCIQLALAIVFTFLTYFTMRAALLNQKFIPVWLLPLALILIFTPIFVFLIRASKQN